MIPTSQAAGSDRHHILGSLSGPLAPFSFGWWHLPYSGPQDSVPHRIFWVNSARPRDFHTHLRLPDCFLPWTSAVFHTLASTRSRLCRAFSNAFCAKRIQTPSLKTHLYHIAGCYRGSSLPRADPRFISANFLKNFLSLLCD